jgi:hypothetical protein
MATRYPPCGSPQTSPGLVREVCGVPLLTGPRSGVEQAPDVQDAAMVS